MSGGNKNNHNQSLIQWAKISSVPCHWTVQWPDWLDWGFEGSQPARSRRLSWTVSVVRLVVVSQETSKCITICYPGATLTPSIKQMDQHRPTQAASVPHQSPPGPGPHSSHEQLKYSHSNCLENIEVNIASGTLIGDSLFKTIDI